MSSGIRGALTNPVVSRGHLKRSRCAAGGATTRARPVRDRVSTLSAIDRSCLADSREPTWDAMLGCGCSAGAGAQASRVRPTSDLLVLGHALMTMLIWWGRDERILSERVYKDLLPVTLDVAVALYARATVWASNAGVLEVHSLLIKRNRAQQIPGSMRSSRRTLAMLLCVRLLRPSQMDPIPLPSQIVAAVCWRVSGISWGTRNSHECLLLFHTALLIAECCCSKAIFWSCALSALLAVGPVSCRHHGRLPCTSSYRRSHCCGLSRSGRSPHGCGGSKCH